MGSGAHYWVCKIILSQTSLLFKKVISMNLDNVLFSPFLEVSIFEI